MTHPLYDDEVEVEQATREHLDQGRTVFQLWQLDTDERLHSHAVLDLLAPPHRARILSLGCGVAGMEAYWHDERPDLRFTLVNQSPSQLELCQCPGLRQCCDVHGYVLPDSARPFDITVLAYVLGHVNPQKVLDRAMAATNGTVLVLDVFDASSAFIRTLQYDAPDSAVLSNLGFKRIYVPSWHMAPFIRDDARALGVIEQAAPAIWVHHA
jgi:hypothetical protein